MSSTALQISPLRLQPATVPPGPRRPPRPELRVLEGGRAPARVAQRSVYRRRRLLVAMATITLALVVVLAWAVVGALAGPSSSPTSAVASRAAAVAAPATVVVQPGDTLWSIAAAVAPGSDVRVTVDRLIALNGAAAIVVGQQLEVPAP